nr:MAG TPA: hypothetical protein [Caudoviricetes sp.]
MYSKNTPKYAVYVRKVEKINSIYNEKCRIKYQFYHLTCSIEMITHTKV